MKNGQTNFKNLEDHKIFMVWYGTFLKAVEVSWNQGISINISSKKLRNKGTAGKNFGVFSPRYS